MPLNANAARSGAPTRGDAFARLLSGWRGASAARPALLMGIVNVTPDSFSDGGLFSDSARAVAQGRRLAVEGAAILDIGGESTRPGGAPVPEEEETRRILPVIEALAGEGGALVSADTTKARVAEAALRAGAHIVNDVRGLQGDPEMAEIVAAQGAGVVIMHNPGYFGGGTGTEGDPVAACLAFFERSLALAARAGLSEDRIALDPGLGFGKSLQQNLQLVARLGELTVLGLPVLVGASRKSFLGKVSGRAPSERLVETLAVHVAAALGGAAILRVHDVAEHVDAVKVAAALRAETSAGRRA